MGSAFLSKPHALTVISACKLNDSGKPSGQDVLAGFAQTCERVSRAGIAAAAQANQISQGVTALLG